MEGAQDKEVGDEYTVEVEGIDGRIEGKRKGRKRRRKMEGAQPLKIREWEMRYMEGKGER